MEGEGTSLLPRVFAPAPSPFTPATQARCNNNLLQGNFSKYLARSLGARNDPKDLQIEINDTAVEKKSEIMLLGVTLDDQLTFSSHISNICIKTSRQIGVLH